MGKKPTPESLVLDGCLQYLELRGVYCWRNNTGTAKIADRWVSFGKKGSSDIIGLLPFGKFLAVETKTEHGRLSPEQSVFLERTRGSGGLAVVVKSWQELDKVLREAGYVSKKRGRRSGV